MFHVLTCTYDLRLDNSFVVCVERTDLSADGTVVAVPERSSHISKLLTVFGDSGVSDGIVSSVSAATKKVNLGYCLLVMCN